MTAVTVSPTAEPAGYPSHPLRRATAWSTVIGLFVGLVLGGLTQMQENDRG
jgi:hypothetical protein